MGCSIIGLDDYTANQFWGSFLNYASQIVLQKLFVILRVRSFVRYYDTSQTIRHTPKWSLALWATDVVHCVVVTVNKAIQRTLSWLPVREPSHQSIQINAVLSIREQIVRDWHGSPLRHPILHSCQWYGYHCGVVLVILNTCRKIRRIMYPERATCSLVLSQSSPFRRQRSVQLCLNGHGPSTERHVDSSSACPRCYTKATEIGMLRQNSLYNCASLGFASCALYERRCQPAFCCDELCVFLCIFVTY